MIVMTHFLLKIREVYNRYNGDNDANRMEDDTSSNSLIKLKLQRL